MPWINWVWYFLLTEAVKKLPQLIHLRRRLKNNYLLKSINQGGSYKGSASKNTPFSKVDLFKWSASEKRSKLNHPRWVPIGALTYKMKLGFPPSPHSLSPCLIPFPHEGCSLPFLHGAEPGLLPSPNLPTPELLPSPLLLSLHDGTPTLLLPFPSFSIEGDLA